MNGNGARDVAYLRDPDDGDTLYPTVEIRDGQNGKTIHSLDVLSGPYPGIDIYVLPDQDGDDIQELVMAGERPADKRIRVQVRGALSPGIPTAAMSNVFFSAGHTAAAMAVVEDTDGNGCARGG